MPIRTTSAPGAAGALLLTHGYVRAALPLIRRGLRDNPTDSAGLSNLSVAHRLIGQPDTAEVFAKRALEADPNCGPAWNNWGMISEDLAEWRTALKAYAMAHRLMPEDCRIMVNYATALMRLERFREAWPLWDAGRLGASWAPPGEGFPVWDGTQDPRGKRILVIREGGYGDEFMFARWFPKLKNLGAEVVFGCLPETVSLFAGHPALHSCVALEDVDFEGLHYCVPLMGLPSAFGMESLEDIPPPITLSVDRIRTELWLSRVNETETFAGVTRPKRVGLCWRAGEYAVARPHRSLTEAEIEPLAQARGVQWFSLCPRVEKAAPCPEWVTDLSDGIQDWEDTAALILNLDLVVTVDTAVAHLAGTLGIPTWILLPRRSDGKWFVEGEESAWYPGKVRLFRRGNEKNWRPVVKRVLAEVERFKPRR